MIVNAPGVLGILVAAMEAAGGAALLAASIRGLRRAGSPGPLPGRAAFDPEAHRHLLVLLALLLATLSAVSLLLWGVLLQSYVPQWADVRCVVGVLRVGTGSEGAPGWLPALADATSALRVGLLFAAGAAVVVHLAGRDAPLGALPRRQLAFLGAVGLLAIAGAAAESAYIVIPKQEKFLAAGCCSTAALRAVETAGLPAAGAAERGAALFALPALALSGFFAANLRKGRPDGGGAGSWARDLLRVAGSLLVLAAGLHFTAEAVAPAVMGLPLHRCAWCLLAAAPETTVGVGLLALPALASGWRIAARRLGPGEGPFLARLEQGLDRIALFGLLGSVLFLSSAWTVAG